MPEFVPLGMRPTVGFAMWHLDRGTDPATVLVMMLNHDTHGLFSETELRAALQRAQENIAATQRVRLAMPGQTLIDALAKVLPADEPVGVRVGVTVEFPDGHLEIISVTVNASSGMTISDVIAQAEFWVNNGGLQRHAGQRYQVTVITTAIMQLIEGGLENPALDLTGL